MADLIRAQVGGHVPIVLKSREVRFDNLDGRLFKLNGVRLIEILKPDGNQVSGTANASFIYVQDGIYVYQWDTSTLSPGDYRVKLDCGVNTTGTRVRKDIIYRLVKQGAH